MNATSWRLVGAGLLAAAMAMFAGNGAPPTAHAASLVVNSTADQPDLNPGDGICAATPFGTCTLRAAVMEANALGAGQAIHLPAGEYRLAIPGAEEDLGATGDLDIRASVTITGASATTTIVNGRRLDRVFDVAAGASVEISGLTITGGNHFGASPSFAFGGGVRNQGSLTLREAAVTDNIVEAEPSSVGGEASGGGIYNQGHLVLQAVTLSGNRQSGRFTAGALTNIGTAALTNVTISGNRGEGTFLVRGTGVTNSGDLSLTNVTVSGNLATAIVAPSRAIYNHPQGIIRLRNTLLAHEGGRNCQGTITSLGTNLENGDTCGLAAPGDVSNVDPRLGPLGDQGGQTQTHPLLAGSPSIDAGSNTDCPSRDQRGVSRPRDGNGDGVATCDIGAVEALAAGDQEPICSPRRPVRIAAQPQTAPGTITYTVTLGSESNRFLRISFDSGTNATVEVPGQPPRPPGFVFSPGPGTQATFTVRRVNPGAFTVRLTVVDACGPWSSFVGGGAGVP